MYNKLNEGLAICLFILLFTFKIQSFLSGNPPENTGMSERAGGPHESKPLFVNGQKGAADCSDWSGLNDESPVQISERTRPLSFDVWETFLDKDGRVVNESAFRRAIFKGIILIA